MKKEIKRGRVFSSKLSDLQPFANLDGLCLRTSQRSLVTQNGWEPYLEALPKSGLTVNGKLFRRKTWVRHTSGKGSGLWPTPVAQEGPGGQTCKLTDAVDMSMGKQPKYYKGKMLPIPVSYDVTPGGPNNHYKGLGHMAKHGKKQPIPQEEGRELFPTPTGSDWKGSGLTVIRKDGKDRRNDRLDYAVEQPKKMYPTPRGSKGGVGMCGGTGSRKMLIDKMEEGNISDKERRAMQAGNGGSLSPLFVAWLMSYPLDWTWPNWKISFSEWLQEYLKGLINLNALGMPSSPR